MPLSHRYMRTVFSTIQLWARTTRCIRFFLKILVTYSWGFHNNHNQRRRWYGSHRADCSDSVGRCGNDRCRQLSDTGSSLAAGTRPNIRSAYVQWFPSETLPPDGCSGNAEKQCLGVGRQQTGATWRSCQEIHCLALQTDTILLSNYFCKWPVKKELSSVLQNVKSHFWAPRASEGLA